MKFYGHVGFAKEVEESPGRWKEIIEWRPYMGDVISGGTAFEDTNKQVSDVVAVGNRISIVYSPSPQLDAAQLRCVYWMGCAWRVTKIDFHPPRVVLSLGGPYRGNIRKPDD